MVRGEQCRSGSPHSQEPIWWTIRNRQNPQAGRLGMYLGVCLCQDTEQTKMYVHRMVCRAFCGSPSPGQQVNHKNGIKADNRASNLEWVTQAENNLHSCRVLGNSTGERNGMSRLTEREVLEIRSLRERGHTCQKVAARYGVSVMTVSRISSGKLWNHLTGATNANV